ncbi:MAG: hypothetical protein ACRDE8_13110, partial [Ginsengibacter sp.]
KKRYNGIIKINVDTDAAYIRRLRDRSYFFSYYFQCGFGRKESSIKNVCYKHAGNRSLSK